jgi:hypothetical protein
MQAHLVSEASKSIEPIEKKVPNNSYVTDTPLEHFFPSTKTDWLLRRSSAGKVGTAFIAITSLAKRLRIARSGKVDRLAQAHRKT